MTNEREETRTTRCVAGGAEKMGWLAGSSWATKPPRNIVYSQDGTKCTAGWCVCRTMFQRYYIYRPDGERDRRVNKQANDSPVACMYI